MPLARYFSFVGGVLLALFFVLDACFPKLPIAAEPKVYLPVIRISSDRKWPERIVYDTIPPTLDPTPVAIAEPIAQAPEIIVAAAGVNERAAFAMLPPSVDRLQTSNAKMSDPKPQRHRKVIRKPASGSRIAMARYQQFGRFGRNFW